MKRLEPGFVSELQGQLLPIPRLSRKPLNVLGRFNGNPGSGNPSRFPPNPTQKMSQNQNINSNKNLIS